MPGQEQSSGRKTVAGSILLIGLGFTLGYVFNEGQDTYHPIFYPNAANLLVYERGPLFYTGAGAREWLNAVYAQHDSFIARGVRADTEPDHEIGVNCRSYTDAEGMYDNPYWEIGADELEVCERTLE